MNFPEKLKSFQEQFEKRLVSDLPKSTERPSRLHEAMNYSLQVGGKRLRPVLVLSGHSLFPSKLDPMPAALAVEIIHTYSLIHDDLPAMDDSDLRRGSPSCHRAFDEATAILCGDALQVIAFRKIVRSKYISNQNKIKIIDLLCECSGLDGLISGQSLDLNMTKYSNLENINKMHDLKTGALFKFCFVSLGILKNLNSKEIKLLEKISFEFGKIFQITDDMLDINGSFEKVGKTLRKDKNKPNIAYKIGLDECLINISNHHQSFIKYFKKLGFSNKDIINIDLLLSYVSRRDYKLSIQ